MPTDAAAYQMAYDQSLYEDKVTLNLVVELTRDIKGGNRRWLWTAPSPTDAAGINHRRDEMKNILWATCHLECALHGGCSSMPPS